MITTNNNKLTEKICVNGCGKLIRWNQEQRCYVEVYTNQKHKCPNWKPSEQQQQRSYQDNHSSPSSNLLDQQQTMGRPTMIDTTERTAAEILRIVKRMEEKLDTLRNNR